MRQVKEYLRCEDGGRSWAIGGGMSKHTPGPWRAIEGRDGAFEIVAGISQIACRAGWCRLSEESIANAHLIAAAPDMLTELARLREELARAKDTSSDHGVTINRLRRVNAGLVEDLHKIIDRINGVSWLCADDIEKIALAALRSATDPSTSTQEGEPT